MRVNGKFVAVEQLVIKKDEAPKAKGIDFSAAFTKDVVSTKVLIDSDGFKKDQILYFRADVAALPQNKAVLSVEDTKFVLLPEDWVVLVKDGK